MQNKRLLYIFLIILQSIIYGVGNPITKIAYESITPFNCLAFRFSLATLVLAVITGRRTVTELRGVRPGDWLPAALCMAGAYITCNVALDLAPATTVGFLMSLPVLFTPFLALLVLRHPYRRSFLPAQLAAVAGLYLLCCNGGAFSFGWGESLALICALCVSGALVWGEKSLQILSPLTVSTAQIAVTCVLSVAGVLIFDPGADLSAIQPAAWLVILYLAILCSCFSYWLQNSALAHIPASAVSLTQCTQPICTAIASFFILGERLTGAGWWGAGLLIACIVYGNYIETKTGSTAPQ